jgi:hypothetical protein
MPTIANAAAMTGTIFKMRCMILPSRLNGVAALQALGEHDTSDH